MAVKTTVQCDCGCKKEIEIGDGETPGAEEILQLTDANGVKTWFVTADCFKKWAAKYDCPYRKPQVEPNAVNEILPGLN